MMGRIGNKKKLQNHILPKSVPTGAYKALEQLNGCHTWQKKVPEGYVLYPVRKLNQGKILYFNFELAKEMGLLSANHANELNNELEKSLLDTFSLRIINEYDQKQNIKYHPAVIKHNPYMATRYLQLQHKDKTGRTSGDGRSIWNGEVEHNGVVWDVSSRGTGVTKLAPGAVEADKPLRSGSTAFGYGCGLADIDELVASAIMAEIFYKNNIPTERTLAVIDLGRGNGIGVRAGKNLLRPAHLFMHLKQSDLNALSHATDYFIDRQIQNGEWNFKTHTKSKYKFMLDEISESFAQFAARMDRDYIFAWLDWDGDNVLANAGIIDYGSIRQFGLRHDEYRYDDVDRFSTNLHGQKAKARQIVQVFAQMVDFLISGEKKPVKDFQNHSAVVKFDDHFQYYLLDQFLKQVGLTRTLRESMLSKNLNLVRKLHTAYSSLERVKTKKKMTKVVDGINRPAIYNMRTILFELPELLMHTFEAGTPGPIPSELFFKLILADSAKGSDRKMSTYTKNKIIEFQKAYLELILVVIANANPTLQLELISEQAATANRPDRLTGDALLNIVDELLRYKKNNSHEKHTLQAAIDQIIVDQSPAHKSSEAIEPRLHASHRAYSLYNSILTLIDGYKESI